jgi:type IV fimbrial biogenesis protein FimT
VEQRQRGELLDHQTGRSLLMTSRRHRGFTLVELLIGIAIAALLVVLALPDFRQFLANTRIRSTADSIANGLRLAQTHAIKRNARVQFILNPAVGWTVRDIDEPLTLASYSLVEGASNVTLAVTPGAATKITFNGLGRMMGPANPDDASVPLASVDISSSAVATPRAMRVVATTGNVGIKMCDPALPLADPKSCP